MLLSNGNPNVAAVNVEGVITTKTLGTTLITATTRYGGKTATCSATVSPVAVSGTGIAGFLNYADDYQYVGGIVGGNNYQVSKCYNTGRVSVATETDHSYAGGIAGGNIDSYSSRVISCYNTGRVNANSAGGIARYNFFGGEVNDYYNIGTVAVCRKLEI